MFANSLSRILIATDFSESSRNALERVAHLPLAANAQIEIVHALHGVNGNSSESLIAEEARLTKLLAERADVKVRSEMKTGEPAQTIVDSAEAMKAELIVLGKSFAHSTFFSSTGEKVSHQSRISALIVSERPQAKYQKPLCAISDDPTFEMEQIIAQVVDRKSTDLSVVHAWHTPLQGMLEMAGESTLLLAQDRDNMEHTARNHLESQTTHLKRVFHHVKSVLREGHAASVIAGETKAMKADLLILMPRGRPTWMNAILGSVTHAVLTAVDSDVLLVSYAKK